MALFIGIDPAFRKNGFALCIIDTSDKTVRFKKFKNGFLDFASWFLFDSPEHAIFCVENSNLQDVSFDMTGTKSVVARKSRNVGKNQAVSQNTVDLLRTKYKVVDCSPKEKGKKWNASRYTAVMNQEKHSTAKNASNQDERDSYQLALIAKQKSYLAK